MTAAETLPWFSGAQTFLKSPLVSLDEVTPGMVVVGGAPHDSTHASRFGTRMGPRGIREGSLAFTERLMNTTEGGLLDLNTGVRLTLPSESRLVDVGDFNVYPTDVVKTIGGIAGGVAEVVRRGGFSVCMGGDHYISYPSCLGYTRAVAEADPNIKIGYIHFDGHLDYGDVNPVWGRYNQGSNARRISEIDVVSHKNMSWIGIHGWVDEDQITLIEKNGGKVFTALDVHEQGPVEIARRAAEHAADGCDFIYMTLDIDFIDTGFFPATGSVVNDAITPQICLQMLQEVRKYPIAAMDIVEVSPRIDSSERSIMMSTELLLGIIAPRIFDVTPLRGG